MKLITLNVWGGKIHELLMNFVRSHAEDTDIFCFQEVFSTNEHKGFSSEAKMDLYQDLLDILPNHNGFFSLKSKGYNYSGFVGLNIEFGNAIFLRKGIEISVYEELFEAVLHPNHDWTKSAVGKAQSIVFKPTEKIFVVCNFHGLWMPGTRKMDNAERLQQSRQLRSVLDGFKGEKILCGDFNLVPDGQSITILEKGMRNLVKDHGITSTRSSFYNKDEKFADYILISEGVKVQKFAVLPDEVSDHLALMLEFE